MEINEQADFDRAKALLAVVREHTHLLCLALASCLPSHAWVSRHDSDGIPTPDGGFFLGLELMDTKICYRLPPHLWDVASMIEMPERSAADPESTHHLPTIMATLRDFIRHTYLDRLVEDLWVPLSQRKMR